MFYVSLNIILLIWRWPDLDAGGSSATQNPCQIHAQCSFSPDALYSSDSMMSLENVRSSQHALIYGFSGGGFVYDCQVINDVSSPQPWYFYSIS